MADNQGPAAAVRLNPAFGSRIAIYAVLFLWPLILFGRPNYIGDSVAYLKGGEAAINFAIGRVWLGEPVAVKRMTAAPAATAPAGVYAAKDDPRPLGVRSPVYSISTYFARFPGRTMIAMALIQIFCAAAVCALIAAGMGATRWWQNVVLALSLSIASPIAAFSSSIEPDIFAGLASGALILLFARLDRLSLGVRIGLSAIIAFAVASHASIPPLALGLCLSAVVLGCFARRQGARFPLVTVAWMTLPVLLGVGIATAANLVAFGDANPNAKRWPLALARSVADGPARWYLEKNCPTRHYAVCEVFPDKFPTTVSGFVFDPTGLHGRATPDQMDRIRDEESEIVLKAALSYPRVEAINFAEHYLRQLLRFGFTSTPFDEQITTGADGVPVLVPASVPGKLVLQTIEWTSTALVGLSLAVVPLVWRRERAVRNAIILLALAFLGNALITVIFSGVAERYQARMIWLLPLIVISAFMAQRRQTV
jgi:hypothetical protein